MRNRIVQSRLGGPTGRRRADAAGTLQARNSRSGGGSSY